MTPLARCPHCGQLCDLAQPAEPDVGLAEDVFACPDHGLFAGSEAGKEPTS